MVQYLLGANEMGVEGGPPPSHQPSYKPTEPKDWPTLVRAGSKLGLRCETQGLKWPILSLKSLNEDVLITRTETL